MGFTPSSGHNRGRRSFSPASFLPSSIYCHCHCISSLPASPPCFPHTAFSSEPGRLHRLVRVSLFLPSPMRLPPPLSFPQRSLLSPPLGASTGSLLSAFSSPTVTSLSIGHSLLSSATIGSLPTQHAFLLPLGEREKSYRGFFLHLLPRGFLLKEFSSQGHEFPSFLSLRGRIHTHNSHTCFPLNHHHHHITTINGISSSSLYKSPRGLLPHPSPSLHYFSGR